MSTNRFENDCIGKPIDIHEKDIKWKSTILTPEEVQRIKEENIKKMVKETANRIHEFTIIGKNAWSEIYLYTEVEEKNNGKMFLNINYAGNVQLVDISDQGAFIRKIESTGIKRTDNKYYENCYEDGYMWCLGISYDDKEIISFGMNAVPEELVALLDMLGCKSHYYKDEIKKNGCEMSDDWRKYIIGGAKSVDRHKRELWEEPEHDYHVFIYKGSPNGRYKIGLIHEGVQDEPVYVKERPVVGIREIVREKYETKIICEKIKKTIITDKIQIGDRSYYRKLFYIVESPNRYGEDSDMIVIHTSQNEDLRGSKQVVYI